MRQLPLYCFGIIALIFWAACDNSGSGDPASGDPLDSTQVEAQLDDQEVSPAESSGLLGTWELIEIRIPTPITVSGTFFTFDSEGQLTISNPDDADLEDRIMPFSYADSSLSYDQPYKLLFVNSDSLVLESETDGIRELNILQRR